MKFLKKLGNQVKENLSLSISGSIGGILTALTLKKSFFEGAIIVIAIFILCSLHKSRK